MRGIVQAAAAGIVVLIVGGISLSLIRLQSVQGVDSASSSSSSSSSFLTPTRGNAKHAQDDANFARHKGRCGPGGSACLVLDTFTRAMLGNASEGYVKRAMTVAEIDAGGPLRVLGPALRPKLTKEFEAWQGFKPNKPTAMRAPAASVTAPDRYILYNPNYGQMNNQKISMWAALYLGRQLNRQVVLVDFVAKGNRFDAESIFHVNTSNAPVHTITRRKFVSDVVPRMEATDVAWMPCKHACMDFFNQIGGLSALLDPEKRFQFDEEWERVCPSKGVWWHEGCIKLLRDRTTNEKVLMMDGIYLMMLPFFWMPDVVELREHVTFSPLIERTSSEFIKKSLPRPYAAVHIRSLEGEYIGRAMSGGLMRDACMPNVTNIMKQVTGLSPKPASVFIAWDGEDPVLFKALKDALAAVDIPYGVFPRRHEAGKKLPFGTAPIDSCLCEHADYFMGSPCSSYAVEISAQRRARKKPPTSTQSYNQRDNRLFFTFPQDLLKDGLLPEHTRIPQGSLYTVNSNVGCGYWCESAR